MNPFQFGGLVKHPYFIDREREMAEIRASLLQGQNLVVYAPRRYGKTSLMKKVALELTEEGHPVIYIDFFRIYSKARFVELFVQEIFTRQKGGLKKTLQWLRKQVRGLVPNVSLNPEGQPVVGINYISGKPDSNDILEVLALPEKLYKDRQVVVIFDEFQEITRLNGDSFEKEIRSVIQEQTKVSYVFMGSKTHMMLDLFNQKERAFYQSAKLYPIGKIPEPIMRDFISKRFEEAGLQVNDQIIDRILTASENIPYYVQFFSAELFSACSYSGHVSEEDPNRVMEMILDRQTDYYTELIEQTSTYQKSVLRALCEGEGEIYSKSTSDQFALSSSSSTQTAMQALIRLGVIEKQGSNLEFSDPFFKQYLKTRYFG